MGTLPCLATILHFSWRPRISLNNILPSVRPSIDCRPLSQQSVINTSQDSAVFFPFLFVIENSLRRDLKLFSRKMDRRVPPGAWDTHFHIFEPNFTPAPATLEEFEKFKSSLGVEYVCVAHGLSYGSNCTSLLHYLHYFQGRASGICVLDVETTSDDLLNTYNAAGVRSARLDFFKHKAMHDLERQVSLIEFTYSNSATSPRILRSTEETCVDPCVSPRRESPRACSRKEYTEGKHHTGE